MHNKLNGKMGEPKIFQTPPKIVPTNMIICFLEVNFKSHIPFFLLRFMHHMRNLLKKNGIVTGSPLRDKATLKRANDTIQHGPTAINQHLN